MTSREPEVLGLIAAGKSNREIGAELFLSVRTVERHITNAYAKIGARNKVDAAAFAFAQVLAAGGQDEPTRGPALGRAATVGRDALD